MRFSRGPICFWREIWKLQAWDCKILPSVSVYPRASFVLVWKQAQLLLKYKCTHTPSEENLLIWALSAGASDHFSVWIGNLRGLKRSQECLAGRAGAVAEVPADATSPWPSSPALPAVQGREMPQQGQCQTLFLLVQGCQEGLGGCWAVWKVLLSAPHKATYQSQEVGRGRVTVQAGIQD